MRPPRAVVLLCLVSALSNCMVDGGTGGFDAGSYSFCVAIRFEPSPQQLELMKAMFSGASQVLLDATDGQQFFKTIKLMRNVKESDEAEFYIHPDTDRSNAPVNGYGIRGEHVNLFWAPFDSNPTITGPWLIVHEFAHHSFGLLDEYDDDDYEVSCSGDKNIDPTLSYCIMDKYGSTGARFHNPSVLPSVKEFCVHDVGGVLQHDPTRRTEQSLLHNGQSCWETIAAHPTRAAVPPAPGQAPDLTVPTPQPVDFQMVGPGKSVVLVIDRSGSMKDDGKLQSVQEGAVSYIDSNIVVGDSIGVVSFDCDATVDLALTAVDYVADPPATELAKDVIGGLAADGGTGISQGVALALGLLTSALVRSCKEQIILLTDGDWNCGVDPTELLPALKKEGIAFASMGIGGDISSEGLANIQGLSDDGSFGVAQAPLDILSGFIKLGAASANRRQVASSQWETESLTGAGTIDDPVKVGPLQAVAEANMTAVTFTLVYNASAVNLTVQDPQGGSFQVSSDNATAAQVALAADVASTPSIAPAPVAAPTFYNFSANMSVELGPGFVSVTIQQPLAGPYNVSGVQLFNSSAAGPSPAPAPAPGTLPSPSKPELRLFVHGTSDVGASLNARAVTNGSVTAPDPVVLEANLLYDGQRVLNATVTAAVWFPNGTQAGSLPLLDEGNMQGNGDRAPGDGYYSGRFSAYGAFTDGAYLFRLTARSGLNGTLVKAGSGESLSPDDEPLIKDGVPDFVRQQEVFVIVTDTF